MISCQLFECGNEATRLRLQNQVRGHKGVKARVKRSGAIRGKKHVYGFTSALHTNKLVFQFKPLPGIWLAALCGIT
jgi:hypothetical protein